MRSPKIMRLAAVAHEANAAVARAEADFQEFLPKGTRVIILGEWRGAVHRHVAPFDGSLTVIPDPGQKIDCYRYGKDGSILVHVERIDFEATT